MKILFVRHGEPDYELDSLTEKGKREAEYLSRELSKMKIDRIYTSPLGRASETASYTEAKTGIKADVRSWLREFPETCNKPNNPPQDQGCFWDWYPTEWTKQPLFYDKDHWFEAPELAGTGIREGFERVTKGLDELLAENGYVREGGLYRAVRPNDDTIVLFCHLGIQAILVGYMMGLSPFVMLHAFAPQTSSVTTLVSEERIQGEAWFRTLCYGSTTHLYINNEPPAFAARFCELYTNTDQRH